MAQLQFVAPRWLARSTQPVVFSSHSECKLRHSARLFHMLFLLPRKGACDKFHKLGKSAPNPSGETVPPASRPPSF